MSYNNFEELSANLISSSKAVKGVSVDLEKITTYLDIKLEYETFEDSLSGFLAKKDNKFAIFINENHHINRKRFTLAHELGHYMLHKELLSVFIDKKVSFGQLNRDLNSQTGEDAMEREANYFASCLLMPRYLIESEISKLEENDDSIISKLSKKLKVSEQAMAIRLSKLGFTEYGMF